MHIIRLFLFSFVLFAGLAHAETQFTIDQRVPTTEVTLTLSALRIQRLSYVAPSGGGAPLQIVVITSPRINFSESVRVGGADRMFLEFGSFSNTAAELCRAFGFGAPYSATGFAAVRPGNDEVAYFFNESRQLATDTFSSGYRILTTLVCLPN